MKLVSWNVNGIRACYDKGLKQFIENYKPDILCLQETKANVEQVSPEIQNLCYDHVCWSSAKRKGYSGVATFSRFAPNEFTKGWGQEEYDSEGRIVISEFKNFDLYNIYFPNGGSGEERHLFKQQFLKDFVAHLKPKLLANRPMIVVGDFNIAPTEIDVYDPIKLSNESGFLPEERRWFADFFKLGFIDTFRVFHPEKRQKYSWWSYREFARISNRGWRIDFICITQSLKSFLLQAKIHDEVMGSDHCPVSIEMKDEIL
jgi:exodeoxyribonuclease-3